MLGIRSDFRLVQNMHSRIFRATLNSQIKEKTMTTVKLFVSLTVLFYLPSSALAEKSCSSFKTEEKCEESYSCSWDSEKKSCKKITLEEDDSNEAAEKDSKTGEEF